MPLRKATASPRAAAGCARTLRISSRVSSTLRAVSAMASWMRWAWAAARSETWDRLRETALTSSRMGLTSASMRVCSSWMRLLRRRPPRASMRRSAPWMRDDKAITPRKTTPTVSMSSLAWKAGRPGSDLLLFLLVRLPARLYRGHEAVLPLVDRLLLLLDVAAGLVHHLAA